MNKKRIVSLLPSATEIVCALGLQDNLVGISHECDYPEAVKHLPICTSSNLYDHNSQAIHAQVSEIISKALSIYEVKKNSINQLQPDVIITQSQCEVCAVSMDEVLKVMQQTLPKTTEIISLSPTNLLDVFENIQSIANALGVDATHFLDHLHERIALIKHKLKFFPDKPKVLCVEWLSPFMTSGNWIPELVEIAGATSVLAQAGLHSAIVDCDEVIAHNPDVIILMPCGFSIGKTLSEIELITQYPQWKQLSAVINNKVFIADGNAYFNRSGSRLVDSVEILAEIIHPKYFNFGYEGKGWIKFEN